MLFLMGVSFYTTRLVLEYLGVMSYGLYNVVGGLSAIFTFVQGSLNLASNRFISYALGQNDDVKIKQTFTSAIQIHAVIGLIILFLGETIGLWYFYNYLNIPFEFRTQSLLVYQFSLFGCVISMLTMPLTSTITAYEDMSIFAKFSLVEGFIKLGVAYSLSFFNSERLVIYALLNFSANIFSLSILAIICNRKYKNCRYINKLDKPQIKEMSQFIGWQFLGSMSWLARTQGVNLVLNYFFGPILNAARAIAVQVNGGITTFLNGFQIASNPQLVKNCASGQIEEMYNLLCRTSKLAYFLLLLLAIPIYFCADYILRMWLATPPEYSILFVKLMIISTLIENLSGMLPNAFVAFGKLKRYQPITASIMMSEIILVFIAFKLGLPPKYMFYAQFIVFTGLLIARLLMLKPILGLKPIIYLKEVILFEIITSVTSIILVSICFLFIRCIVDNLFINLIIALVITTSTIYTIGLNTIERRLVISIIKTKLHIE